MSMESTMSCPALWQHELCDIYERLGDERAAALLKALSAKGYRITPAGNVSTESEHRVQVAQYFVSSLTAGACGLANVRADYCLRQLLANAAIAASRVGS
jgi:hypothetical protein